MQEGAETFFLPGSRPDGVLLVHGFTGSPSEMRLIGEYLNRAGYPVLAPRLAGHGTTVEEMARTDWRHWYASVVDGYRVLSGHCRQIHLVGLSMGGLLALKLGRELPVSRVACLSAPVYINDSRLRFLPFYRLFRSYAPKRRRVLPGVDPRYLVHYDRTPLRCVASLLDLIRDVTRLLPKFSAPLLVVQSQGEHTVKPESAQYIYDQAGSQEKELCWLQKSGHLITLDTERETVFTRVLEFLRRSP
ncbi:MAG TPA: alpha/beta fold hydrolase [Patescibacteria group bacterium]|nr:alpha/beta fold hydrolase [Patescibacteria group bacterium]